MLRTPTLNNAIITPILLCQSHFDHGIITSLSLDEISWWLDHTNKSSLGVVHVVRLTFIFHHFQSMLWDSLT